MATTKPLAFPRWNTGAANRTEPVSGKKDLGWIVDEQPPSSFFNWLLHFGGLWDEWANERMDDGLYTGGGDSEDFYIHPPTPAAAGGSLSLKAADGLGSGDAGGITFMRGGDGGGGNSTGGAVNIDGGEATGNNPGGNVIISGGNSDTFVPGGVIINGGDASGNSVINNGNVSLITGQGGGTNNPAGTMTLTTGSGRGSSGGTIVMRVAPYGLGSGTDLRAAEDYLTLGGDIRNMAQFEKRVYITNPDVTRGQLRMIAQSTTPVSMQEGEIALLDDGRVQLHNGTSVDRFLIQKFALLTPPAFLAADGVFAASYTIPAAVLTTGSTIRIQAGVAIGAIAGTGTLNIRVRVDGQTVSHPTVSVAAGATTNDFATVDATVTIRAAGALGQWASQGIEARSWVQPRSFVNQDNAAQYIDTTTTSVVDVEILSVSAGDTWGLQTLTVDWN